MNKQQFLTWLKNQPNALVMGVLNVTPDSFYDGGRYTSLNSAYQRAQTMINEGVDIIDIGGESTRPGAKSPSDNEELDRVIPIIEHIRAASDICISIDTSKPLVMQEAVKVGANLINDVRALSQDSALSIVAKLNVPLCLMHMQGSPVSMQNNPQYTDLIKEINLFFEQRILACLNAGIKREYIILDPGFGFGKSAAHNLLMIKQLNAFQQHHLPLLLGVSRKSTIGAILQQPPTKRLPGSLALAVFAVLQGVSIIRTHDVAEMRQALMMIEQINKEKPNE